jgi:hypothetical protein
VPLSRQASICANISSCRVLPDCSIAFFPKSKAT